MAKAIPEKVIGRLARYRGLLVEFFPKDKTFVFSHEIARMGRTTPSQVRRDLMYVGYYGAPRHGYEVSELVTHIGKVIDSGGVQRIALVGVGNLGRALLAFSQGRRASLEIVAAFDSEPSKVNRLYSGVKCYPIELVEEIVKEEGIGMAILCVPGNAVQAVADRLCNAGIRGLMNFAPAPLRVPAGVYLEETDFICGLEKVAYFTTHSRSQRS